MTAAAVYGYLEVVSATTETPSRAWDFGIVMIKFGH
jgi:hypothetical protein